MQATSQLRNLRSANNNLKTLLHKQSVHNLIGASSQSCRAFGYTDREIRNLQDQFTRRLKFIRMSTEDRRFNYEQPEMTYDKKTGDVIIHEKNFDEKSKLISNLGDLEREKRALESELNPPVNKKQKKRGIEASEEEKITKFAEKYKEFIDDTDVDLSKFQLFSRD